MDNNDNFRNDPRVYAALTILWKVNELIEDDGADLAFVRDEIKIATYLLSQHDL